MLKRRLLRTVVPLTLMMLGIAGFVYGFHFRSFSVDQEVTRTVEIPPPEIPAPPPPPPGPEGMPPMQDPMMGDPMMGGPMQDPMMPPTDFPGAFGPEPGPPQTVEITEMVSEKVGERALVKDATIGGIREVDGRLVRTYSPGQAPDTCPT
jgi:hypothetical protein